MYYFIVNPSAGSGRGRRVWKAIACYMDLHNIEYEAVLTGGAGEARIAARELTERNRQPGLLIVVGGSGTVNEVLDGVVFHGIFDLGYIPAGTGNDLSRCLHMPQSTVRCLKKQLYPRHFSMVDYGVLSLGSSEISHRRFMVSAGMGFDTVLCCSASASRLRGIMGRLGLGRLSGFLFGLCQVLRCRSSRGYILLDGVKKVEFNHILFISCHIQPSEGGGFAFAPRADGSDGRMNICVVSHSSRKRLIPVMLQALTGRFKKHKGARVFECREVSIHTDAPLPVHADGEFCGMQTDLRAECISRQIRMGI